MRITVFIALCFVTGTVSAQPGRHYDFPQMLSNVTPMPPSTLEDAAKLSEHQPKHLWHVGKLLMQADTEWSKQYLLAQGSDTNAATLTPTKSQGKQVAEATKMANRMKDATGGVSQADIKKMSMAEKLAFAEKMRSGMAKEPQQGASMSEMMSIKRADEAFGPAVGLMNNLYRSIDSLQQALDRQHTEIDGREHTELENCPKVKDDGSAGESAPATPCEIAAHEHARTGHRDVENNGLAAAHDLLASYKQALMPYLEAAMRAQNQMKDGKTLKTPDGIEQYRLFLGNVIQTIAAITHNTVNIVDHADKWEPMS